jgi:predicted RNase H-like HicB family nuclease
MSEPSEPQHSAEFTVTREDEYWVATHVETGVASHGDDPTEAVAKATEAAKLFTENPEPTSEAEQEAIRRELGIDVDADERGIDSPSGMP